MRLRLAGAHHFLSLSGTVQPKTNEQHSTRTPLTLHAEMFILVKKHAVQTYRTCMQHLQTSHTLYRELNDKKCVGSPHNALHSSSSVPHNYMLCLNSPCVCVWGGGGGGGGGCTKSTVSCSCLGPHPVVIVPLINLWTISVAICGKDTIIRVRRLFYSGVNHLHGAWQLQLELGNSQGVNSDKPLLIGSARFRAGDNLM